MTHICSHAELAAMIEATGKLLGQVMQQQAAASHLSALSVECGGTPLVLEELQALAEEASLKALLWTMQQEMREAAAGWMSGPLFGLDVADMQAKVSGVCRHGKAVTACSGSPKRQRCPRSAAVLTQSMCPR
jgi:hypothetical protein